MPSSIPPSCGYTTASNCLEWMEEQDQTNANNGISTLSDSDLIADPDRKQPLYFWQIYSLIREKQQSRIIHEIITNFYQRIFDDHEKPHFRDAFTRLAPLEHHVMTQAAYWQDSFGGGKIYHGSDYRLNFHHHHNARSVMNEEGASRWMFHMSRTLHEFDPILKAIDPRILDCLVGVLEMKMKKYADQFRWNFQEDDFISMKKKAVDSDVGVAMIVRDLEGMIVYGRQELKGMNMKTLKRVCKILEVDVTRCYERGDIIRALEDSGSVIIVDPTKFAFSELREMSVNTLKKIANQVDVDLSGCVEKLEMIHAIVECDQITVVDV